MIVVEIQDPEDGRVGFRLGPFASERDAHEWRDKFVLDYGDVQDEDFVEVRDVDLSLLDPNVPGDMDVIRDFYGRR